MAKFVIQIEGDDAGTKPETLDGAGHAVIDRAANALRQLGCQVDSVVFRRGGEAEPYSHAARSAAKKKAREDAEAEAKKAEKLSAAKS
jgi:hypothetical protein